MTMERTALTRALAPLYRDGLLSIVADAADGRARRITLTPAGRRHVRRADCYWEQAETIYEARFGKEHATALRATLADVEAAAWAL